MSLSGTPTSLSRSWALLERVDDRPHSGGWNVETAAGQDQIERLDIVSHEAVDPVELGLKLGVGGEVPGHAPMSWLSSSARARAMSRGANASNAGALPSCLRRPCLASSATVEACL